MELTDFKYDSRGDILKFKIGTKRFLVIFTKKGFLRAGEIHNVAQYTFLVSGKIEVITKEKNENVKRVYEAIQEIKIAKNTPHYFRFLENSILIESEEKNLITTYYPEYRKIVEESL
jgi:hypothetical protein